MPTTIKCPACGKAFSPDESIRQQIQQEANNKVEEWKQAKEKEYADKIVKEKQAYEESQAATQKKMEAEHANQVKQLAQDNAVKDAKLRDAQQREIVLLQKEKQLQEKESEAELTLARRLSEEKEKMKTQYVQAEQERNDLKEKDHQQQMAELKKQLEDQKKLADEMKRKSEQGSMQLQGEVQELLLEEKLQNLFPIDKIEEVGKGVRGADCIQTVMNKFGNEVGKIVYESKNTKDFKNEWLEKLKQDQIQCGADVAVLVTHALPKEMERKSEKFIQRDGIFICTVPDVPIVAALLRDGLLKFFDAKKSQENKGDKIVMLYNYFTSREFTEQWNAISEGYRSMHASIQNERNAMEKLWKAREKSLDKVLRNVQHIQGSILGIAGNDVSLSLLLEEDGTGLLEE